MKNKKKEVKSKNNKKPLIITIIVISLLFIGFISFFVIKKYTGIDYKLKNHGYTKEEISTLKEVFNKNELSEIIKKDYNSDYVFIIKSNQFQKDKYLVYLDELKEGKKKEDILNDLDPVVQDLRGTGCYNEEYLSEYLNNINKGKTKDEAINFVNYIKDIESNKEYKEEYQEEYYNYHIEHDKESNDNVIKYINFKNSIKNNSLYKEEYKDKYMEYYMKNQGKS